MHILIHYAKESKSSLYVIVYKIPFALLFTPCNKKTAVWSFVLLHTAVSLFFPLSDYLCTRFLTITIAAASAASAATPIPTPATRGRLFFTFLLPSRSLSLFGTSSSSRSFRSWSAFGVSSSPMVVVSSLPCAS